jgi:ABC-type transport system involved in multi-copper enzyme maturation permease subunit
MEPQWTKKISSNTVCTTYYVIFWLYIAVAVLVILGTLALVFAYKMPRGSAAMFGFQGVMTASLACVLALFQYLVCSRALLGEQTVQIKKVSE